MKRRSPIRKRSERGKALSYLDSLVRQLVLARDGNRCVRCGGTKSLQAAHILPKGHYPRLRFELDNVLSLDVGCHLYWAHRDPIGFTEWLEQKYPGRISQLRVMAAVAGRLDLKQLKLGLQLEARKL